MPARHPAQLAPPAKKSICIDDLRQRILTQALQPGEHLDEVEIAKRYGISRPPVREALRQLSGEGYVVLRENRSAQVAPMTYKTLRNFFIAAPMIYAAVARLAAENATAAGMERLKQTQMLFRKAIKSGDTTQRALLNERFHAAMGEMADNEYLIPSLRRLLIDHTRIGITFYSSRAAENIERQAIAADHHDHFISLIGSGEADKAAELAIEHWDLSRAQIERYVAPNSVRAPLGSPPEGSRLQVP